MHNAIRCSTRLVVCAATIGASANAAWATTPSFTLLGSMSPLERSAGTGISGDGSVATGYSYGEIINSGHEAFGWTESLGMFTLGVLPQVQSYGFLSGLDASFDGSVIVGSCRTSGVEEAFLWTQAGGMVGLGDIPGGPIFSQAHAVTADGTIVVGFSQYANGRNEAFVWTAETGMLGIGDFGGTPIPRCEAYDIAPDGSVIVGGVGGSDASVLPMKAAKWTWDGGWAFLGDIPGGPVGPSRAHAVNADGSIIVGQQGPANANDAFWWTEATGPLSLGPLPSGYVDADATGVSPDGSLIVGSAKVSNISRVAMIWTPFTGWVPMGSTLTNIVGIHVLGTIIDSPSLSDDGRTIVATTTGWEPGLTYINPSMACRIVLPGPGACCIGGGCVDDLDPIVCSTFCGVFVSDEQTCATLACESFGACVFQCSQNAAAPCPDGVAAVFPGCAVLAEADCDAAGGLFVGGDCNCRESFDPCPTDVNGDGATNITDFNVLASNFGQGNPDCRTPWEGDLTCDGVVDISDFNILAGAFGCGN